MSFAFWDIGTSAFFILFTTSSNGSCSVAFDIFKRNDSNTYYHIGCFQGDYIENEDKEYFSFWRIEGKIVSPKNDSDYTILTEIICNYFESVKVFL